MSEPKLNLVTRGTLAGLTVLAVTLSAHDRTAGIGAVRKNPATTIDFSGI